MPKIYRAHFSKSSFAAVFPVPGDRRDAVGSAFRDLGPVIYAVLTDDGFIKIGRTRNLKNRLGRYGIGIKNARRILMVKPGTSADERAIHAQFAEHVAQGHEYYHPTREILDYINAERDRMGVPPLDQL
jgi:hypothetical protein